MWIKCPSGCVCELTPAELAHRVSRFGQTAKQHLLPVGVRRLSQLVLWTTGENDSDQWKKRKKKPGADALTAVYGLHLPVDGVADHQGADKELSPPKRVTDRRDTIKE